MAIYITNIEIEVLITEVFNAKSSGVEIVYYLFPYHMKYKHLNLSLWDFIIKQLIFMLIFIGKKIDDLNGKHLDKKTAVFRPSLANMTFLFAWKYFSLLLPISYQKLYGKCFF